MERLTEFHNGIWGMSVQAVKDGYDKYSVFHKLAEYEDTGLTPEEITEFEKLCVFWQREAIKAQSELGEMKIAEEQGLLIKLPCKVGDTVYVHHRVFADTIVRCQVIGFAWWGTDGFCVRIYSSEYGYGNACISFNEFGRTIFTSREAAEAALKGGEGE